MLQALLAIVWMVTGRMVHVNWYSVLCMRVCHDEPVLLQRHVVFDRCLPAAALPVLCSRLQYIVFVKYLQRDNICHLLGDSISDFASRATLTGRL